MNERRGKCLNHSVVTVVIRVTEVTGRGVAPTVKEG